MKRCEACGWDMTVDGTHACKPPELARSGNSDVVSEPFNSSGSKYLRQIRCLVGGKADVYAVLDAFGVTCPARQHAIKKLLCSGIRGKGDVVQDLGEALDAVARAIQMEKAR